MKGLSETGQGRLSTLGLSVQKRQLSGPLPESPWSLSDEPPERSGEMGLIEVSGLMDGVEDGDSPLEKALRMAGTLDPPMGARGSSRLPGGSAAG
jgi:hypothetical protein